MDNQPVKNEPVVNQPNTTKKPKNTKMLIASIVAFVVAFVVVFVVIQVILKPSKSKEVAKGVEQAKSQVSLPATVDQLTTLTDIKADGDNVRYEYIIDGVNPKDIEPSTLEKSAKQGACTNEQVKKVLDKEIGLSYNYTFKNAPETIDFTIVKADC